MLRHLIGEDVELSIEAGPGAGHVYADPSQIEQVLLNLAVNARDAMPTGGRLTVAVASLDVDGERARAHPDLQPGPWLVLTVSDTSSGMEAETRAHAFEPFFTTKAVAEGTGLGLATVYGIVRQSGGYIEVESEPGHGATFRIDLPRFVGSVDAPSPAAPASPPRGSETILLVEDEPEVRTLLHESLAMQGYRVWTAGHAEEALAVARGHPGRIDLLITDVVLPGLRGDELARGLVGSGRVRSVLYTSGYPDTAALPKSAFLQKPFTPAVLARKTREILDAAASGSATGRPDAAGRRP